MSKMLKTSEVARELGVTVYHVDRWIRQHKIAALRLPSGTYRVSEDELERIKKEGAIERSA